MSIYREPRRTILMTPRLVLDTVCKKISHKGVLKMFICHLSVYKHVHVWHWMLLPGFKGALLKFCNKNGKAEFSSHLKITEYIFTHPFHIKSSNEAYFSKYVLNCIDTHPPVYQPHTADIFKPAVGDTKLCAYPRWEFQQHASWTFATLSIDAVFVNQPLSVHIKFTHTLMINPLLPEKLIILQDFIYFVSCSCWM